MSAVQQILLAGGGVTPVGQQAYTTPGVYYWTVPDGVTSVCVVCVGSGATPAAADGGGGAGGGLAYRNNIAVTPGESIYVSVGAAAADTGGDNSWFGNADKFLAYVVAGGAGNSTGGSGGLGTVWLGGGTSDGQTAYKGGDGGTYNFSGGGGGAGGYSGAGGAGAGNANGSGGAGGAGGGGRAKANKGGAGGGGVGILGEGSSGNGGYMGGEYGAGGSGGGNGARGKYDGGDGAGGAYGGGRGGGVYGNTGLAGGGAVRIIWGAGRAFPSTNTGDM